MDRNTGDSPASSTDEAIHPGQRASDEFRSAASRLRRRAAELESIAYDLDRCVPTNTDGCEDHPHIGEGSDAEEALWHLALAIA